MNRIELKESQQQKVACFLVSTMSHKKGKTSTRSFKDYTLKGKTLSGLEKFRSSIVKERGDLFGNLVEAIFVPTDMELDCLSRVQSSRPELTASQVKKLAEAEAQREWISLNTIDLFNCVATHYSMVQEYHAKTYHEAGKGYPDGYIYRFPGKALTPAYEYAAEVLKFAAELIDNPEVFPELEEDEFPPDFMDHMQTLYKRLLRLYALIFAKCGKALVEFGNYDEVIVDFKKFYYFVKHYNLLGDTFERETGAFLGPAPKKFAKIKELEKSFTEDVASAKKQ